MFRNLRQELSRRRFVIGSLSAAAASGLVSPGTSQARGEGKADARPGDPVAIGSRRELFVDDLLIDRLGGKAELRLGHPQPQEIVLKHDAPWEGSGSGYHSAFHDGERYRMYYKAWHLDVAPGKKLRTDAHPLYCCYAESLDGIHWLKPDLGLFEHNGSKANNIVMTSGPLGPLQVDAGHPAVFKDDNLDAPAEARYKAFFRSSKPNGLLPFQSPDGLHWSPMSDAPVITNGAFDSQNLAFWDPTLGKYRAYWRYFTQGKPGIRAIRTATSPDFLHWGDPVDLTYTDSPHEELYTNQVKPYARAPHLLIGFPTRYTDRGWSTSMKALPEPEHREARAASSPRYGTAITDALFMASRDGERFKRWNEAFLRPGIERPGTWNYGQQYLAWHPVETKSRFEGAPPELSFYASESYWTGDSSEVRRYTMRLDGFVSLSAPMTGGELVTRPLTFNGNRLTLNVSTSAAGSVRVELQSPDGHPLPGFAEADCDELFGDSIDRAITWKQGEDLGSLAGKPIRIRFLLKDADVYSFQFHEDA
ncbi:MAG: hypothetical protein ABI353_20590 [Isosphaeraceae bacterium]